MQPKIFPPEQNGWNIEDEKYSINWFDGPMTPPTIEDILACKEEVGATSLEEEEEEAEESGNECLQDESDSSSDED